MTMVGQKCGFNKKDHQSQCLHIGTLKVLELRLRFKNLKRLRMSIKYFNQPWMVALIDFGATQNNFSFEGLVQKTDTNTLKAANISVTGMKWNLIDLPSYHTNRPKERGFLRSKQPLYH